MVGDDGHLRAFGRHVTEKKLIFMKFNLPDVDESNVSIRLNDAIGHWEEPNFIYEKSVSQSGKVYSGKLHYVFGTESTDRHINVYDTQSHEKVEVIELNNDVREEPEDLEILPDGGIILALNGGYGYYIISNGIT